jgi:subtilisin family serine protease
MRSIRNPDLAVMVFAMACTAVTACALDPADAPAGTAADADATAALAAAPGELARQLASAMRDNRLTAAEWNQLAPLANALPHTASADANALVTVWADRQSQIASSAIEPIRKILDACGYGVPRTTSEPMLPSAVLIADNLTTPDADFEAVAAAAGLPAAATVTVAVLDDGISFAHPALAGHQVTAPGKLVQWDFVENDATLPAADHGTAVSSIAARGGQRVKILPLRIAINAGIPSTLPFGQIVSDAIDTAAAEGCPVVSISYVTNRVADIVPIRAAMARHPETLFVLAAGNGNTTLGPAPLDPDHFLATMHADNVIIAANATRDGVRWVSSFDGSNVGTPWVDIAMRGMDYPLAIASGAYGRSRGTSSATPNIAAVAARVRLLDPSLTAAETKALLYASATVSSAWTGLVDAGGLVDQPRAIRAAAGL